MGRVSSGSRFGGGAGGGAGTGAGAGGVPPIGPPSPEEPPPPPQAASSVAEAMASIEVRNVRSALDISRRLPGLLFLFADRWPVPLACQAMQRKRAGDCSPAP